MHEYSVAALLDSLFFIKDQDPRILMQKQTDEDQRCLSCKCKTLTLNPTGNEHQPKDESKQKDTGS